ncbi:substrate-binding domain-containing protein [Streptomyces sp. INA 01156]
MQLLLIFAGSDRERQRLADYLAAHRVDGCCWSRCTPTTRCRHARPAGDPGRDQRPPVGRGDPDLGRLGQLRWRPAGRRAPPRPGRRRIAHITGRLDVYGAQRRIDGYRDALRDAGHEVDDLLVEAGDFSEEGGRHAMAALLERRRPGRGLRRLRRDRRRRRYALREAGRRIPDDVALVGYDDSAIARHMDPPLTSVRQPIEEMGHRMIDLLLAEIADRRPSASRGLERRQVVLATELVERTSS